MGRPPGSKNRTGGAVALAKLQQQETATALERQKRDEAAIALLEDDEDDTDVMFAPGRSDQLCGVIPEPDKHYCICTENLRTQGRSRPNMARLLSQGYEVARLPNGELADWPEISKAIMFVPLERWNRYQKALSRRVAEASGIGKDGHVNHTERIAGMDVRKSHSRGSVSPAEMGITPEE